MLLNHEEICRLIPHSGKSCLLDEVLAWDDLTIVCRSLSHRSPDNPLRSEGMLSSVHTVEYAAQAMAVHGALITRTGGDPLPSGVLVSLRGVKLAQPRLDTIESSLLIEARQLLNDTGNMIYSYSVSCDAGPVSSGQLAIALVAKAQA